MNAVDALLSGLPKVSAWQESLYRDLHAHPELSHHEARTAAAVVSRLTDSGWEVTDEVGGTGVVGVLHNGTGPTVLMRADMDALPVAEDTGLDYASTVSVEDDQGRRVPVSHACGHDMHVTCLLGAAALLAAGTQHWSGTAVVLFQPAEETADGARGMLDDGLATMIPRPDVAFGQHVLVGRSGTVGTRSGPTLSAADSMRITIFGRGGHGSMPQATIDPVVTAAAIVLRLQTIVSREVSPTETAVLTVGSLHAGSKSNIIPDTATVELNVRTYSEATRHAVLDAIGRIVRAECAASGSSREPDLELFDRFPLTHNDETTTARVSTAFAEFFGADHAELEQQTASEDFSDVPTGLDVPYTYWGIGGTDPDTYARAVANGRVTQDIPANHSPQFAPVIQPTCRVGTQAMVVAALAWLAPDAPRE